MMTKLVACPFCGATPTLEDHRTMWVVRCICGASMLGERAPEPESEMPPDYWQRFEQSAIDRWNKRSVVEPAGDHIVRLFDEVDTALRKAGLEPQEPRPIGNMTYYVCQHYDATAMRKDPCDKGCR